MKVDPDPEPVSPFVQHDDADAPRDAYVPLPDLGKSVQKAAKRLRLRKRNVKTDDREADDA